MAYRSKPQRPTEELHEELIESLGWAAAHRAIESEAEAMRLDPTSPAVIRSAWATHNHHRPVTGVQEGLLP